MNQNTIARLRAKEQQEWKDLIEEALPSLKRKLWFLRGAEKEDAAMAIISEYYIKLTNPDEDGLATSILTTPPMVYIIGWVLREYKRQHFRHVNRFFTNVNGNPGNDIFTELTDPNIDLSRAFAGSLFEEFGIRSFEDLARIANLSAEEATMVRLRLMESEKIVNVAKTLSLRYNILRRQLKDAMRKIRAAVAKQMIDLD